MQPRSLEVKTKALFSSPKTLILRSWQQRALDRHNGYDAVRSDPKTKLGYPRLLLPNCGDQQPVMVEAMEK
jgi:hypothetical protein